MTITFVHSRKAFLPEIDAYTKLFDQMGFRCKTALPHEVEGIDTAVEWHFMGTDTRRTDSGRIKIHEYASGSVGTLGFVKDLSKKMLNTKPDFRLFLNPYVKKRFGFTDNIPFGYRDMGVDAEWLLQPSRRPASYKFDFVYIGDLSPARQPEKLLDVFTRHPMKDRTLLIIGNHYAQLQAAYQSFSNITFTGPCAHAQIPSLLAGAHYGINYIIDKEPFNRQTSTKLLEYAACGLPIVSTRYNWIEAFQAAYGGNYYYLDHDLSNFTWDAIADFQFSPPDLTSWTWERQIGASGIIQFLHSSGLVPGNS